MISLLYSRNITDATCGFRAFRTKIFEKKLKFLIKKNFILMVMSITASEW